MPEDHPGRGDAPAEPPLEQAIARLRELPVDERDAAGHWLLAELTAKQRRPAASRWRRGRGASIRRRLRASRSRMTPPIAARAIREVRGRPRALRGRRLRKWLFAPLPWQEILALRIRQWLLMISLITVCLHAAAQSAWYGAVLLLAIVPATLTLLLTVNRRASIGTLPPIPARQIIEGVFVTYAFWTASLYVAGMPAMFLLSSPYGGWSSAPESVQIVAAMLALAGAGLLSIRGRGIASEYLLPQTGRGRTSTR